MKFIRKILAVCMALVILVSTTSFTMSMHFCGDELQNFSFFTQASSCEMEVKTQPPCHKENPAEVKIEKKSCCKDQTVVKEGQEVISPTVTLKALQPDLAFVAVVASFLAVLVTTPDLHYPKYYNYRPPLIERDIPVFVQSFLI